MKRISSRYTSLYKRLLPFFWFGFIVAFLLIALQSGIALTQMWLLFLMPLVMAVVGFLLIRKLIWDLADEVTDGGEYLLVKFKGEEERIALSNIMNVNVQMNVKPARITLRLVQPGKFGSEVAFSPPTKASLNPFVKNEVAEDLIVRVDRARRG